jgi:hypothetical protein
MLIAAAVCPHPPLLVPAATGAGREAGPGRPELDRLRDACRQAVAALLAERPDLIAVVGADPRAEHAAEYPPDAPGHLHDFGVPYATGPARPGAPSLPLSLTVGRWLLSGTVSEPPAPPAAWWGIAPGAPAEQARRLGEELAALAPRVALLALGDGPGRRARAAPGAADPEADRYDDQVAAALGRPDPAALGDLDPGQDAALFVAGRAAWQVLAGAAGRDAFTAALGYRGAPFEVSYYVAGWRRAH